MLYFRGKAGVDKLEVDKPDLVARTVVVVHTAVVAPGTVLDKAGMDNLCK